MPHSTRDELPIEETDLATARESIAPREKLEMLEQLAFRASEKHKVLCEEKELLLDTLLDSIRNALAIAYNDRILQASNEYRLAKLAVTDFVDQKTRLVVE